MAAADRAAEKLGSVLNAVSSMVEYNAACEGAASKFEAAAVAAAADVARVHAAAIAASDARLAAAGAVAPGSG